MSQSWFEDDRGVFVNPGISSGNIQEGVAGNKGIISSGAGDMIGAAINFASTMAGIIGEHKLIKKQAKLNRQLAQEEFDRNYELWKEQNMYNAPSSQMARLKAAGLNPAILYGGSSGSVTGNSDSVPKLDYSGAQLSSYASPLAAMSAGTAQLGAFLQARMQGAQIENLTANAERSREDASRISIDRLIALEKLPYVGEGFKAQIYKDYAMSTEAYAKADEATKNLELLAANVDLADTKNKALRLSLDIQEAAKQSIIDSYTLNNRESRARISEIYKRISKYDQEILNLKEDWWKIQADTYKASAEGDVAVAQREVTQKAADKIEAEIARIAKDTELSEKDVKYYFYNHVVSPLISAGAQVTSRIGAAAIRH